MGGRLIIAALSAALMLSGQSGISYAADDVTESNARTIAAKGAQLDTSPPPEV